MAVTVSDLNVVAGSKSRKATGKLAFDASYPTGGESVTAAQLGLSRIDRFEVKGAEAGYVFEYDYTNQKIKVYRSAGFTPAGTISAPNVTVVQEEVVAVSTHTGTLANIPALVTAVHATAGTTPGPKQQLSAGTTPGAGQVAVNLATGVLTFATAEAITSAKVSYLRAACSVPTFTGTAVSAAALAEVANATDLSALTAVEFEAEGI